MPESPRDPSPDCSFAFARDPYRFIGERCRRFGPVFVATFRGEDMICVSGAEAAELFYDPERFTRRGATPARIRRSLFGAGGVQGLEGEPHARRKAMFLSVLSPRSVARLADTADEHWDAAAERWAGVGRVVFYEEAKEVLCRAACAWAGVPLGEPEVGVRTAQFAAMFEGAGALGSRHRASRLGRARGNRWASGVVERIRSGAIMPPDTSAAAVVARHEDADGPLPARVAAVELLNVLRPIVAVAVAIAHTAHALHTNPAWRERIARGGDALEFVQEVRRLYPFFPTLVARARRAFEWKGHAFRRGARVMLDLYGTNRDPRVWDRPEEFDPERFARGCPAFGFIPQGGGDAARTHRCPGDAVAIELMRRAARFLTTRVAYTVPDQDLRIDTSSPPALPRDGFVIAAARRLASERRGQRLDTVGCPSHPPPSAL
jgi:fatty-acid peroxygenase